MHISKVIAMTPATSKFKPLVNTSEKFVELRKGKFSFERFQCSRWVSKKPLAVSSHIHHRLVRDRGNRRPPARMKLNLPIMAEPAQRS